MSSVALLQPLCSTTKSSGLTKEWTNATCRDTWGAGGGRKLGLPLLPRATSTSWRPSTPSPSWGGWRGRGGPRRWGRPPVTLMVISDRPLGQARVFTWGGYLHNLENSPHLQKPWRIVDIFMLIWGFVEIFILILKFVEILMQMGQLIGSRFSLNKVSPWFHRFSSQNNAKKSVFWVRPG